MFRDTVRNVFDKVMTPKLDRHAREGVVARAEWRAVGEAGLRRDGAWLTGITLPISGGRGTVS